MYVILFVAAALPFIVPIRLPLFIWSETRSAFDATDSTPPEKVVAINSDWIGGSQGENWPQYEAVVSHCMMRGIKFFTFALDADPLAPQMAEAINERQAKLYGRTYGKDWVNLGLTRGAPLTMSAIGRSVKSAFPSDFRGVSTNDYEKLPIMRQINSVRDIHVLWAITYQPNLDWCVFLDPSGRTPIVFGSAGIVTTSWYPYIASGQLRGMLAGVRGAAEYETLLEQKYGASFVQSAVLKTKPVAKRSVKGADGKVTLVAEPAQSVLIEKNGVKIEPVGVNPDEIRTWRTDHIETRGRKLVVPLAFGYLIIILFIVVGNLGMFARKRLQGGSR